MNRFTRLCRHAGLMIHHITNRPSSRQQVKRTVEEKRLSDRVTLRRTTIDEVEIKRGDEDPDATENIDASARDV